MTPDPDSSAPTPPPSDPLAGLDVREALAAGMQSISWEPPQPQELAAVLPEYAIDEIIGRGGMGVIYKARDIQLDRMVAIKLLPPELSSRVDLVERFTREARALARLDHQNIVKVHDFSRTTKGHLYFVMEYVEGLDLSRIIRTRQEGTPPKDHQATLEIIGQICDALQYAHSKGIVHRDIKPANVLISKNGQVKVADFGLARATEPVDGGGTTMRDSENMTISGMIMGTLEYMAPEQREGLRVDHRADIYAVGVLFYQMLTGHLPRGAFLPPSRRTTGVDARLDKVVLKALQTEPAERYQRASEVRDAVQALHKLKSPAPRPRIQRPETPPAPSARSRISRLSGLLPRLRAGKPMPVWGGGVLLALCSVFGLYSWNDGGPGESGGRFPVSLHIAEALPRGLSVRDGIFERTLPEDGVLPLEGFYLPQSQALALTFHAPGYQPRTLLVERGSAPAPQKIQLEPLWAELTWTPEPAGWFSALRLSRPGPLPDPRVPAVVDLPPAGGRSLAGPATLSGLWGPAAVPLGSRTLLPGPQAYTARWPLPGAMQWTGMATLNPQSCLTGLTGPFRKAAAAWNVNATVPFFITFQPGGQAELKVLNAQVLQLALQALIAGSLPTGQWEDEAAVTSLFREEISLSLNKHHVANLSLGDWFSKLWRDQSRKAGREDARSSVLAPFRDQAGFLTSVLKAEDPRTLLQDPRHQEAATLFFDTFQLTAIAGSGEVLHLEAPDAEVSLKIEWSGAHAEFLPRSRIPVRLKPR